MWQLLMALRDCELKNDALMDTLYDIIMENIRITTPYAIYVFHDNYDIPAKATDKERLGESEEMFPYLICAICPLGRRIRTRIPNIRLPLPRLYRPQR